MEEKKLTYTEAANELEQIVQKMQSPDCDIDQLSTLTKRAKELIDLCKKRLTATDEELKKILESITNDQ